MIGQRTEKTMFVTRRSLIAGATAFAGATMLAGEEARAASATEINTASHQALAQLYRQEPHAKTLSSKAVAILVFPKIYKGGIIVGGQTGDGALLVHSKPESYYNISAASFGLQLGGQTFAYALFFMNEKAVDYLRKSDGWAIGTGPSVVVMDEGKAASLTSTTLSQDVYAFPFGAKGLMAGLSIEGSKITQIHPG
jgi:lipid-binding SYLF domain-containing protein